MVEVKGTKTLLSCRSITLDKKPVLRAIVIGEVLQIITGKVIVFILKEELIKAAGSLQVFVGQKAGTEATIHSMNEMYNEKNKDAISLADAKNAFNLLNRHSVLHYISSFCPSISAFLKNCYSAPLRLFILGGTETLSKQETTQGDPVSVAIYDIEVTHLIDMLFDILINEKRVREKS